MYDDTEAIVGEMVGIGRHRVRASAPGRVCEHPGCIVVLSIYNSRHKCAGHDFDARLADFGLPRSSAPAPRKSTRVERARSAAAA